MLGYDRGYHSYYEEMNKNRDAVFCEYCGCKLTDKPYCEECGAPYHQNNSKKYSHRLYGGIGNQFIYDYITS